MKLYRDYLSGTIHVNSEHMMDIHNAFMDSYNGEVCKKPMIELTIPSVLDDSLNKTGNNNVVATMFV